MKKKLSALLALILVISCVSGLSALAEEPVTLSLFMDETWWPYRDWTGTMPMWATEKTGVTLDVTVATDPTELSMMIIGDTLPDIVVSTQFNQLSDASVCYDLEELIEKYDIDWAIHPAYKFVNQAQDGKVYTVKVGWSADYEYEQYPSVNPEGSALSVRKDVLEAVLAETGLAKITTVEELEQCFEACKKLYPDMVPYLVFDPVDPIRWLQAVYGAGQSGFVDVDGKAKLSVYDEHLKDALLKMNEWIRKGYVLTENLSWSGGVPNEWIVSGKVFAAGGLSSGCQVFNDNCKNADVPYEWVPVTTLYTDSSKEYITDTGFRGIYITKNCSDPEAAIRFVKFLLDKETNYSMLWGREGIDWNWNEDKTECVLNYSPGDNDFLTEHQLLWGWINHDGINNNMWYGNEAVTREALTWVGSVLDRNPVLGIVLNSIPAESQEFIIYQDIQEMEKLYTNKILTAKTAEEAESLYNEMIKTADSLGGQDLNDWANESYPELKAEYEKVRSIGAEGWLKK